MRTFLLALLTLSATTHAGDALQLPTLKVSGRQASGTCGPASIRVAGLVQDDASGHSNVITPHGEIRVISGSKQLVIGEGDLQDRNMAACLSTPKGPRLVVAIFCDGRSCPPVDYWVFDPAKATIVSKPADLEGCSLACAEEALGVKVPEPLAN
ncbi:hypothetical protein [Pseudoxanthomonas mexicana]